MAGLLEDVKSLISSRSRLRTAMLDALHSADIEIVSPNFMNTRSLAARERVIPDAIVKKASVVPDNAESLAFDKAEDAASVEKIRTAIESVEADLKELGSSEAGETPGERERLEAKKARLSEHLQTAEAIILEKEKAEKNGGPD